MAKDDVDVHRGRGQGRPPGSAKETGREHLLMKAREAMRLRPRLDIQRRELAEHAGVTPALVSYYFPDRTSLLELAAQPVIDSYVDDVRSILDAASSLEDKLERLIGLFLAFNSEQGFILDHVLEISRSKAKADNLAGLRAISDALTDFFEELIAAGTIRNSNAKLVQAAIWGICRHVGRGHESDLFQVDHDISDAPDLLARQIFSLVAG